MIWLLLIPLAPLAVCVAMFLVCLGVLVVGYAVRALILMPCGLIASVFAPKSRAAQWFDEVTR